MFDEEEIALMAPGIIIGDVGKDIYYEIQNYPDKKSGFELKKVTWNDNSCESPIFLVSDEKTILKKTFKEIQTFSVIVPRIFTE